MGLSLLSRLICFILPFVQGADLVLGGNSDFLNLNRGTFNLNLTYFLVGRFIVQIFLRVFSTFFFLVLGCSYGRGGLLWIFQLLYFFSSYSQWSCKTIFMPFFNIGKAGALMVFYFVMGFLLILVTCSKEILITSVWGSYRNQVFFTGQSRFQLGFVLQIFCLRQFVWVMLKGIFISCLKLLLKELILCSVRILISDGRINGLVGSQGILTCSHVGHFLGVMCFVFSSFRAFTIMVRKRYSILMHVYKDVVTLVIFLPVL